jgi:hypothetical protein
MERVSPHWAQALTALRIGKHLSFLLIGSLALGLSGCATKRLKVDFTGFEKAYAETSNQDLLLNLARLENRDPTYFFKIGQITSAYKMAVSLSGNAGYSLQSTNVAAGSPTGSGTPSATYENDPIFTFIPVNDETNARLLLKPIPADDFYFLYAQGWRADQLIRLMVDRIEIPRFDPGIGACKVETVPNRPPTDPRDSVGLNAYVTFLRLSAVVYWLHKHGYMNLRITNTFQPYSMHPEDSGLDDSATTNAPKTSDYVNAQQKGALWEHDTKRKKWVLGENVPKATFFLTAFGPEGTQVRQDLELVEMQMMSDPEMSELSGGSSLHSMLLVISNGFDVEGSTSQQNCPAGGPSSALTPRLILRSLIGTMSAAAQEQAPFDALQRLNPLVYPRYQLTPEQVAALGPPHSFIQLIPPIERHPLLRLRGRSEDQQAPPIAQLIYRGKIYRIADYKDEAGTDNEYWNRDVFRLINHLSSQVTVDISKFPLTEILQ